MGDYGFGYLYYQSYYVGQISLIEVSLQYLLDIVCILGCKNDYVLSQ